MGWPFEGLTLGGPVFLGLRAPNRRQVPWGDRCHFHSRGKYPRIRRLPSLLSGACYVRIDFSYREERPDKNGRASLIPAFVKAAYV